MKRSEFESGEESDPEINPFLVEPIILKLLKFVEKVSQLKELRLICQVWDEFILKEIEDRAFNGKLRPIAFHWINVPTKSGAEVKFVQFLEDTSAIPRLFSSFKFNFPESWAIFQNHMEFFSIYPVTFVHLGLPINLAEQDNTRDLLVNFMKTEIWGNLKKIIIYKNPNHLNFGLPEKSSLFHPGNPNSTQDLNKLKVKTDSSPIIEIFESAFGSGWYSKLRLMEFNKIPMGIDFPGLEAFKLTRLEIEQIGGRTSPPSDAIIFTSDLIKLARNGMKLEDLDMSLTSFYWQSFDEPTSEILKMVCTNLSQFLTSQSSTLKTLNFGFDCRLFSSNEVEDWCKIQLPRFEVLHSLKLKVSFEIIEINSGKNHTQLFGMTQDLAMNFPKLVKLTLMGVRSLTAFKVNPVPDEVDQLQLKCLEIIDKNNYESNTPFVMGVIGSVEELTCSTKLLFRNRLPWGNSLRSLFIYDLNSAFEDENEEHGTFNLNHFKKLEKLYTDYKLRDGYHIRVGSKDFEDYLSTFQEATHLQLKSITFIGLKMAEEVEEEFIKFFPFPVEFKNCL